MPARRLLLALALSACGPARTDTGPGTTTAATDTSTGTTTLPTTTGAPTTGDPGECRSSDECPDDQACLRIPCEVVLVGGCNEYACQDTCSWPYDETSAYACVDDRGCCSDSICLGDQCVHVSEPFTTSSDSATSSTSSTSSTSTGPDPTTTTGETGETTGAPPACEASSDCPGDGHCLIKPCELVMNEPGCGEFRCYPECSDPFTDSAFWTCADDQACCGGYPCLAGMCTEMFSSET